MNRTVLFIGFAALTLFGGIKESESKEETNFGDFYIGGLVRTALEFDHVSAMGGVSFDYMTVNSVIRFQAGCDGWIGQGALGGMVRSGVVFAPKVHEVLTLLIGVGAGLGCELLNTSEMTGDIFFPISGYLMTGLDIEVATGMKIRIVINTGYGYFFAGAGENIQSMILRGGIGVVL